MAYEILSAPLPSENIMEPGQREPWAAYLGYGACWYTFRETEQGYAIYSFHCVPNKVLERCETRISFFAKDECAVDEKGRPVISEAAIEARLYRVPFRTNREGEGFTWSYVDEEQTERLLTIRPIADVPNLSPVVIENTELPLVLSAN